MIRGRYVAATLAAGGLVALTVVAALSLGDVLAGAFGLTLERLALGVLATWAGYRFWLWIANAPRRRQELAHKRELAAQFVRLHDVLQRAAEPPRDLEEDDNGLLWLSYPMGPGLYDARDPSGEVMRAVEVRLCALGLEVLIGDGRRYRPLDFPGWQWRPR